MVLSSSIREVGEAVDALVRKNEVFTVSASEVATAVRSSVTAARQHHMYLLELAAHAIACNQHNEDQAASGATWLASLLDITEWDAKDRLASLAKLNLHPFVLEEARAGTLSFEKAAMIARVSDGSASCEDEMLAHAHSDSFEALKTRGLEFKARGEAPEARTKRLRKRQYVRKSVDDDGMVSLHGRWLPENALGLLTKFELAEKAALKSDELYEVGMAPLVAEAFGELVGESGGSSKPTGVVNFHVRLEDDGRFPEHAEVPGVGLMPVSVLNELAEHPLLRLIIEAGNKILFYSSKKYKPDGPLMQWQKDMAKARAFDICETPGCTKPSNECDHIRPRDKGGTNEPVNLQGVCEEDHDAKTRKDAPWTAGGIFGKKNRSTG